MIRRVTVWDTGTYTCEVEADMEEQTTVAHFLQVLGEFLIWWNYDVEHFRN